MPSPFETWGIKEVTEALAKVTDDQLLVIRKFIDGDHWQDSAGWVGPRPQPGEEGEQETLALLKQGFTSSNKIAEVCERHADGVIGREPRWSFALIRPLGEAEEAQDAEDQSIREAEAAVTSWWNNKGVHACLLDLVTNLMWAKRAPIRLYITEAALEEDGTVQVDSIEAALKNIYIDTPPPENATVYVDPRTKKELGILQYKTPDDKDAFELSYVDDDNITTIIRQIIGDVKTDFPLNFGGRITTFEMRRATFISEQIIENQKSLNLSLTTVPRTVTTAGFLERILTNAMLPGKFEIDPESGDRKRFIPGRYKAGASTTNFVSGIEQVDAQGNITNAIPGVHFREPVDPEYAIKACEEHYTRILQEAKQIHVRMADQAGTSGRAHVEARADYSSSLRRTTPSVEAMGRWLIETVLAVAEQLVKTPGKYTLKVRSDFVCRLFLGTLSTEERQQNAADVDAGLYPAEYAMSESGIDDTAIARQLINADPINQLKHKKLQAEVMQLFTSAGSDVIAAATLVGMTPAEISILSLTLTSPDDNLNADPNADPNALVDDPNAPAPAPTPAPTPAPKPAIVN